MVERTSHTQSSDQVEQVDAYQTYLVVKEQASTPATVKAIEGALYPLGAFEITACIPGIVARVSHGDEYAVDHVSRDGVHKTIMVWAYRKQTVNGGDFVCTHVEAVETRDCPRGLVSYVRFATGRPTRI